MGKETCKFFRYYFLVAVARNKIANNLIISLLQKMQRENLDIEATFFSFYVTLQNV